MMTVLYRYLMLKFFSPFVIGLLSFSVAIHASETERLFDMSLEELLQVRMGSLTETDIHMTPASVTVISSDDIRSSGARSMYELLDIMVPNLQVVNHNYGSQHVGVRGVINDRDTTYLLILNGKILNHRSKIGATTELDFPMLADIKEVHVVRGAGSAVYGPGAIAGVISVKTFDGETLDNNELVYRKGVVEDFNSYEFKYKKELRGFNSHLMVYYGFSDYKGASSKHSPYYSSSNTFFNGLEHQQAGEPLPYDIPNDKANSEDQDKHKLHLQLDGDNYSAWFRYSQGGYQAVNEKGANEQQFSRGNKRHKYNKYQQASLFFEQTLDAPFDGDFTYTASAQITEAGRIDGAYSGDLYTPFDSKKPDARRSQFAREDEFLLSAIYSLESKGFKHVYGLETTKDVLGKKGLFDSSFISSSTGVYPDGTFHNTNDVYAKGEWNVSTYAAFSEFQWDLFDNWTAFAGARLDKHDYSDWLFSPRASLIFRPSDEHIFKAILNKSVKRASEIDMRIAYLEGENAAEEKISSIEFIHETVRNDKVNFKTSVFSQEVEFWSFNKEQNNPVGTIGMLGAEFELSYKQADHRFFMSHSYTKLSHVSDSNSNQYITAKPYGYGNDLNTWSNHITKLNYAWQLADTWQFTSSLRVYWQFDGAKDYGDYNNEQGSASNQQRFGYDDNGQAYKGNYYLNFGLSSELSENLNLQLNLYNSLGWFDKKYNKRNYLKRFGDYRAEAAALAFNLSYTF